ncbi:MAG: lipopolysaccharide assembly protein LapA domain-containing protein [Alphaproteobacteria bacterium]|nr:lipopolysaccharide assembly protein LapA domain-containing protein [Alphaproteobacteria bacterium]
MRILLSVFGIVLLALVLSFAMANKVGVDVTVWPLGEFYNVPLYAVGLVPLGLGFLLGALFGLAAVIPQRLRVRRLTKELGALSSKIGELQNTSVVQQVKGKKPSFWSRK